MKINPGGPFSGDGWLEDKVEMAPDLICPQESWVFASVKSSSRAAQAKR